MPQSPGTLRRLIRAGSALVVARAEFASVELALARVQFMRWLALALLALLLGLLGLLTATAVFALALWPLLGWGGLLLPAIAYLAACAWVALQLKREVETAPPLLHETLQELARDRAALEQAMGGDANDDGDAGATTAHGDTARHASKGSA